MGKYFNVCFGQNKFDFGEIEHDLRSAMEGVDVFM